MVFKIETYNSSKLGFILEGLDKGLCCKISNAITLHLSDLSFNIAPLCQQAAARLTQNCTSPGVSSMNRETGLSLSFLF